MNLVDRLFLIKLQNLHTSVVYFHVVVDIYAVCVMPWCSRTILYYDGIITIITIRSDFIQLIPFYIICYYFIYTRIGVPTYMYNNNNNIICILHVRDEFNRIIISNVPIPIRTQHIHPHPHLAVIHAPYDRARGKYKCVSPTVVV